MNIDLRPEVAMNMSLNQSSKNGSKHGKIMKQQNPKVKKVENIVIDTPVLPKRRSTRRSQSMTEERKKSS